MAQRGVFSDIPAISAQKKVGFERPNRGKKMPFWEFIDIEYDDVECTFHFTAHFNLPDTSSVLMNL